MLHNIPVCRTQSENTVMETTEITIPPPPPLTTITGDDLRRHFIRHLYAITASMDPRVLLNILQTGEAMLIQSELSPEARHLCTLMRRSLQNMDAQLLQERPSTNTSNRGIHSSAVLTTDLNIHAKNDSWFQNATDASQHIATEVLRHLKNCVNLERQTAAGGVDL